ncbi:MULTISPECIES: LysM peptidoglycan-binding domain-containing protein [Pseudarthrobacter]|uniref:LysM repeat protein n=1 Tax=Pseudarthrobacter niigatensis TaxID=369935 RepID=A0AAJ1SSP1_9MICC|nr:MULTISPECIES: LysM peptidoglycan-binding domain-containing protein [Pseudarthrobacter]MDQ0144261.1 LysM repeat protein [Pseudarthrobacter niigatensis]MDQ0266521.1 LysM repeat protein [Pseudarthrobacter niigatensis]QDG63342.1 peptidoglycan endopeptidase [Pseudarthrobacter sp. NIBRBAC000502771]QDG88541.1 peptidoglycan endopeptidase [Pseudarthrobacter sp. NIBRBAC000502770]
MSKNSISARHRATPARSIVLEGLAVTAKSQARSLGRPALAVAAASGIAFGVGAPAHAGVTAPDTTEQTSVQATAAAPAAAPAAAAGNVHTVVSGDTLGAIAAAYGVNLNDVLSANGLGLSSVIYPGDQIQIPGAGYTAAPAPAPAAAPVQAAAATAPANTGMNMSYASATPVASTTGTGTGAAILASAYSQLGVQQDCTAMVEKALRSVGKSVGDLAPTQFFQYGTVVGSPAPGDLIITSGHVGVYAGNGQVVSGGVNGFDTQVHSISWLGGYSAVRVA